MPSSTDVGCSVRQKRMSCCNRQKGMIQSFARRLTQLEMLQDLDYGIVATVFVSQFFINKEFNTFTISEGEQLDFIDFALMAEMGFFTLTGDRYQMTVPEDLNLARVKAAHLTLAATDDDEWIHPERIVISMPYAQATEYQRLLSEITQDQRLADRRAILFLD